MSRSYAIKCDRCGDVTSEESTDFVTLSVTRHDVTDERICDYIETSFGTLSSLDLCIACFEGLVKYVRPKQGAT